MLTDGQASDAISRAEQQGRLIGTGYHHRNLSVRLPDRGAGAQRKAVVKVRKRLDSPQLVERVWADESRLLLFLESWRRATDTPQLDVEFPHVLHVSGDGVAVHRYVRGRPLLDRFPVGTRIPSHIVQQLARMCSVLALVAPDEVPPLPRGWPCSGDSSDFLAARVEFARIGLAEANEHQFGSLFRGLGIRADAMDRFGARVPGLTARPFALLHTDLHRANVIIGRNSRITVIDWEHASFGDPLYELATHLCRMRYPRRQARKVVRLWEEVVGDRSPASVKALSEDLPWYLAYERAQSVYPDIVRASLDYAVDPSPRTLHVAAGRLQRTLAEARTPLALESALSETDIRGELLKWHEEYGSRAR